MSSAARSQITRSIYKLFVVHIQIDIIIYDFAVELILLIICILICIYVYVHTQFVCTSNE